MVGAAALPVALVRSDRNLQLARLLSNSADRMSRVCAVQISMSTALPCRALQMLCAVFAVFCIILWDPSGATRSWVTSTSYSLINHPWMYVALDHLHP
jgi:hypothetical protein